MKHLAFGCMMIFGLAGVSLTSTPADARGGVNSSYARAYCQYYQNKSATVARGPSTKSLASSSASDAHEGDRRTAEYWRQAYRKCLKENGY